jgi:hypothetical protein
MGITIKEFTVAGFLHDNKFAHRWYIGCDNENVNEQDIIKHIDETLCRINDDYAVERTAALTNLFIEVLPSTVFIDFLHATGKYGAMNKFPRVLKNKQYQEWADFVGEKVS